MDTLILKQRSVNVRASVLLTIIALGLIGNYFKYPIFLNIDFLFGSIFAMLALQLFGLGSGIAAGAITAVVTYFLWNHPYAIVIMTAEVAAVGLLMRHKNIGMVLADAIYWLVVGVPLVFVFYHGIMDVPVGNTTIVMTKQAVNGVANALVARLLYSGYAFGTGSEKISYRDLIYNLLSCFAICPALILLMASSNANFLETDRQIRDDLVLNTRLVSYQIDVWSRNRSRPIDNLAKLALTLTPAQMQPRLVQAHNSDVNFLRIGLLDKNATIVAYYSPDDKSGQQNIGRNFADRPYIARLKQTLKPMLSEVVMGHLGKPKPMVTMLAPVVKDNEYQGYVSGVLSLDELEVFLNKSTQIGAMLYTLLDTNGNVILTNHNDQKVMQSFVRSAGNLNRLDESISQWIPKLPPNTPISEQWRSSFYVADSPIGGLSEWRLVLEQPVAPFQKVLYAQYTNELALLFILLFTALALAEFLSRKVVARTDELILVTKTLSKDLSRGIEPVWPESNLKEHHNLIGRFKEMAESLSGQFRTNKELTVSLENRIAERTAALTAQKALEETVRQLAFYDSLTKLPNRRLLIDRLNKVMAISKRSSTYAALMFLDLDNFKPLNDTHGHGVGDLLLIEVANRLTESVREMDTVARFGGDEFVVLLGDLGPTEPAAQALVVAEKIRTSLAEPYFLTIKQTGCPDNVVKHQCSVSIGVAVFVNHDLSETDVLKWADDAMYQAKERGRNSIQLHGSPLAIT